MGHKRVWLVLARGESEAGDNEKKLFLYFMDKGTLPPRLFGSMISIVLGTGPDPEEDEFDSEVVLGTITARFSMIAR